MSAPLLTPEDELAVALLLCVVLVRVLRFRRKNMWRCGQLWHTCLPPLGSAMQHESCTHFPHAPHWMFVIRQRVAAATKPCKFLPHTWHGGKELGASRDAILCCLCLSSQMRSSSAMSISKSSSESIRHGGEPSSSGSEPVRGGGEAVVAWMGTSSSGKTSISAFVTCCVVCSAYSGASSPSSDLVSGRG